MMFRVAIVLLLVAGQPLTAAAVQAGAVDRQLLEQTLDGTQQQIERARQQVEESSQQDTLGPSLDLAEEALVLVRSMTLDGNEAPEPQRLLDFLNQAQARIEELRSRLGSAPEAARLRQQLDHSEQQLERARQALTARHASSRRAAAPRMDAAAIYARAQRRLDEARYRAKALPNADALLRQLDAAQQRLDTARAQADDLPTRAPAGD